jgi:hypothetical protein
MLKFKRKIISSGPERNITLSLYSLFCNILLEVKFSMKSIKHILIALFVLSMFGLTAYAQEIPQAIVFEDPNMTGSHTHFSTSVPDLDESDNFWNDKISSIVVISGTWTFLADPVGAGDQPNKSITLGPGVYPDVTKEGMDDNSISQVRLGSES